MMSGKFSVGQQGKENGLQMGVWQKMGRILVSSDSEI